MGQLLAAPSRPEGLPVQVVGGQVLAELRATCSSRFRPIYLPSLLPALQLINLGFHWPQDDDEGKGQLMGRWLKMVFLREWLRAVEPIAEEGSQMSSRTVYLLSDELAARIKSR